MQYKLLGKSQLLVSEIGLGCMSLPAGDAAQSSRIINGAIGLGVNYFDTADLYNMGRNEEILGTSVKSKRKDIILATKVGNQWKADGTGWNWNPTKQSILGAVEQSLKRLQTDYIDLYQLHGGTIEDPIDDIIEAFELLTQQGKIRYYGISSIRPVVIRAYVKRSGIVSVMLQYSLADRRPEEAVLDFLQQHDIGVLSRGALAQGLLVNKSPKEYLGHSMQDISRAADMVKQLSSRLSSPAQTAIRFVLDQPAITTAVVGCSSLSQLEEAVSATGAHLLPEDLLLLRASLKPLLYEQHR